MTMKERMMTSLEIDIDFCRILIGSWNCQNIRMIQTVVIMKVLEAQINLTSTCNEYVAT